MPNVGELFEDFHGCIFVEIDGKQVVRLEQPVKVVADSKQDILGLTGHVGDKIAYLPWHRVQGFMADKESGSKLGLA